MLNSLINESFYVLDTETTGLCSDAQIIEFGLIDQDSNIIIDTLVKPISGFIPADATAIHGITSEQAMDEGVSFSVVNELLHDIFNSSYDLQPRKDLVIYNSDYDVRLINQTCASHGLSSIFDLEFFPHIHCAMLSYAEFYGQKTSHGYKWQSLVNACLQQNVYVSNAHRAVGDCQMTLELIKKIWS